MTDSSPQPQSGTPTAELTTLRTRLATVLHKLADAEMIPADDDGDAPGRCLATWESKELRRFAEDVDDVFTSHASLRAAVTPLLAECANYGMPHMQDCEVNDVWSDGKQCDCEVPKLVAALRSAMEPTS